MQSSSIRILWAERSLLVAMALLGIIRRENSAGRYPRGRLSGFPQVRLQGEDWLHDLSTDSEQTHPVMLHTSRRPKQLIMPGQLAFSFKAVEPENLGNHAGLVARISCEMALSKELPSEAEICSQSVLRVDLDKVPMTEVPVRSARRRGASGASLFQRLQSSDTSVRGRRQKRVARNSEETSVPKRMLLSAAEAQAEATRRSGVADLQAAPPPPSPPVGYFTPTLADVQEEVPLQSRYSAPFLQSGSGDLTLGNWSVGVSRSPQSRSESFRISKADFFSAVGEVDLDSRGVSGSWSWKDKVAVSGSQDLANEQFSGAVKVKGYGVKVMRNNLEDATAVDVTLPFIDVGTMANVLDRNYGARVHVRDFEIMVRHDFDEHVYQDPSKLASQMAFSWKDIGVSVGTDLVDTRYAVGVGIKGYKFSALRDFDDRQTDFVGNWGDGWQLYLSSNLPDTSSRAAMAKVGFGNIHKTYVMAGAGIGEDGIPEFNARYQGRKAAVMVDLDGGSPGGAKSFVTGEIYVCAASDTHIEAIESVSVLNNFRFHRYRIRQDYFRVG